MQNGHTSEALSEIVLFSDGGNYIFLVGLALAMPLGLLSLGCRSRELAFQQETDPRAIEDELRAVGKEMGRSVYKVWGLNGESLQAQMDMRRPWKKARGGARCTARPASCPGGTAPRRRTRPLSNGPLYPEHPRARGVWGACANGICS